MNWVALTPAVLADDRLTEREKRLLEVKADPPVEVEPAPRSWWTFEKPRLHEKERQRNQEIRRRYRSGDRPTEIAQDYGISRQRVYQILGPIRGIAPEGSKA